jgi:deazaflavin-dependent oxidoreductase (nitroreductase family)
MGFNRVMIWLLRSPLHRLFSGSTIVLRVTGVRSGRRYDVPVNFVPVETTQGKRLLVTSQRDRTWWRNLRDRVEVELTLGGELLSAHAQVVEAEGDVAAGLQRYFQVSPKSARYFGIDLTPNGEVGEQDLQCLAGSRVVIWVDPSTAMD